MSLWCSEMRKHDFHLGSLSTGMSASGTSGPGALNKQSGLNNIQLTHRGRHDEIRGRLYTSQ